MSRLQRKKKLSKHASRLRNQLPRFLPRMTLIQAVKMRTPRKR